MTVPCPAVCAPQAPVGQPGRCSSAGLGATYGKVTAQLFSSPGVAGSGRLVPQPTRYPGAEAAAGPMEQREVPEPRPVCWGAAHAVRCSVIPGYTGFIPRAQNLFAKTYTEICREARSDFARRQLRATRREQELHPAGDQPQDTQQAGRLLTASYRTLHPAAAAPNVSPNAFQLQDSPYSMEENNPHKCFISGFTGFVPRARFLIGAGYPLTTHRALVEFSQMGHPRGSEPEAGKGSTVLPPLLKTYRTDRGLLPHYAGYVPGYKFQFGHTYGHLTHNALGLSALEKQLAD
uniref:Ciliary microtubule inner protein 2B n=1 Tax=Pelusios castaneus TaxID=367368 RepID=A0A8C8S0J7_9SAUR